MEITSGMVKELREKTGAGLMDCKAALTSAGGDMEKAIDALRTKGLAAAAKKSSRIASEGLVVAHVDENTGTLVEINCETDFVAKNEIFKELAHEIALQVASMSPKYISREDVPKKVFDEKKAEFAKAAEATGKPKAALEKIVEGQLNKYFGEVVLLEQTFWKDEKRIVGDVIDDAKLKLGENIKVSQMARIELGVSE